MKKKSAIGRSHQSASSGGVYSFGTCRIEVDTRALWCDEQRVDLRSPVFDLIVVLLRARPRVVGRTELARAVWKKPGVSAGMVAKAVMEARRAIGDSGTDAGMIVSVHGVGYRFAAEVTEGSTRVAVSADEAQSASFRAMLDRATRAFESGDHALAQLEAERALMQAESAGVNRHRVQAMLLVARVGQYSGSVERISMLAHAALRLAQAEQQADLVCEAQIEFARIHLLHGSAVRAIDLLKSAAHELQAAEPSRILLRCEQMMMTACWQLLRYDEALGWVRRVQDTARHLDGRAELRTAQHNEVALLVMRGMWLAEGGHEAQAQASYTQALEANAQVPTGADEDMMHEHRLTWLGNQGMALTMLGRTEEAWSCTTQLQQLLDHFPRLDSPFAATFRANFHGLKGLLLARSRRVTEAFEEIEAGAAMARALNSLPFLLLLCRYGVDASLVVGLHEKAFHWLRELRNVEREMETQQAQALTALLRIESDAAALAQKLQAAEARVLQLEATNASLSRRISELEGAELLDALGFGTPAMLHSAMATAHARARARDLPYCLLMLAIDNHAELVDRWAGYALDAVAQVIAATLRGEESIHQPVVRWRASRFLMAADGLGPRRAQALAATLVDALHQVDWTVQAQVALKPVFVCRSLDATEHDSLADALRALE